MPIQIPSTGRSFAIRSRMIASPSTDLNPCIHAAKAPTPGTTRPSASSAVARSDVTTTSTPEVAKALCAERKLPEP